ncbi:MAG: four helix bundle protein [Bacteroidetes bacterium]|jgi:four helix bundle protein|nr:four helix bundle protein [Bacteroidota bacterium]
MSSNFRDLRVYKIAYSLAMDVFEVTKSFPKEETYALTDQVRRSSRSVCRAIGEGYRKRQYPKYFVNKISDADMENTETQISLDFAESCGYIESELNMKLQNRSEEVGRLLNHMIQHPQKYRRKSGS